MPDRRRTFHSWFRIVLAAAVLLALGACSNDLSPLGADGPGLAPQASGSFSGGSLSRGSVVGFFEGVGIGNTPHQLTMTVDGVQWFECQNNGGNLAPGQLAFEHDTTASIEDQDIDGRGRFEKGITEEGPPVDDSDCKRNWSVHGGDEPITFLQVEYVRVDLFEIIDAGTDHETTELLDTFEWTCEDPDPTIPLEAYVAPPLTGDGGVCTLVVDGAERGGGGKGATNG